MCVTRPSWHVIDVSVRGNDGDVKFELGLWSRLRLCWRSLLVGRTTLNRDVVMLKRGTSLLPQGTNQGQSPSGGVMIGET